MQKSWNTAKSLSPSVGPDHQGFTQTFLKECYLYLMLCQQASQVLYLKLQIAK